MRRAVSLLACFLVGLAGCLSQRAKPYTPQTNDPPLYRDETGRSCFPDEKPSHITPERIHGGII